MSQLVEVSFTVDGITSPEMHDTISDTIDEVTGLTAENSDYFKIGEQTIWYTEGNFSYGQDFRELAQQVAEKIKEKTGSFHKVELRVSFLEQCPYEDFTIDDDQETEASK